MSDIDTFIIRCWWNRPSVPLGEDTDSVAVMQRGVGGIAKGQSGTYTVSDGKKIQKVTEVVTGTGSVVKAVSFHHR